MINLNSYRDFIDSQERTYMTEDEKLEKKNSEILTLYKTAGDNISRRQIPEYRTPKTGIVGKEPENTKKKCNK